MPTQTCAQTIDCLDYQDDDSGSVLVFRPSELVQVDGSGATPPEMNLFSMQG